MSASKRVIGVDPGGRQTGLVVMDGDRVVRHDVLERTDRQLLPGAIWLDAVAATVHAIPADWLAVEGVTSPNWFNKGSVAPINLDGLLGAALILGAVVARSPIPVAIVPPGGHGSLPLAAYPAELVGPRERSGSGRLRHCRSAYDVVVHARRLQLLRRTA